MKVDLSINPSLPWGIKVYNAWEGVSVLLSDLVEAVEVVAKLKGAILLFDKEDRGTCRGVRRVDEATLKVSCDKLFQCLMFGFQEGIEGTKGWCLSVFQLNLCQDIIFLIFISTNFTLLLTKHSPFISLTISL